MRALSRVGFAVAAAVVVLLGAVALRAERVLGDAGRPSLIFDVDVPPEAMEEMRVADIERVWRARLAHFGRVKTGLTRPLDVGSMGVRVEVLGARPADLPVVERALTASALVQLRAVVSGSETVKAWGAAVQRGEVQLDGAEVEPDYWVDRGGGDRVDFYVRAADRAALDRAVTALSLHTAPPPGVEVLYEAVVPHQEAEDPRPYLRSYLVSTEVVIDNDDFVDGAVTYDPNTLRPEVAVELSKQGGWAFGDATAAMIGEKIAIVVDGEVMSAPVVMDAIRGGRLSITMGVGTPREQEADAQALVAALGTSARVPAGLRARHVRSHAGSAGVVWTARLGFALLGGVLVWFLPVALGRRRWFAVAPSVTGAPFAAPRWDAMLVPAGVTIALPTLLWFASREPWLVGVNHVELSNLMAAGGAGGFDSALLGIFSLGVVPVISAFVLTELAAAALGFVSPAWRRRRLGTPADRRRLDLATWLLVPCLAALQAYLLASYLDSISARGAVIVTDDHAVPLITLTLTAGVMASVVIAELISRHGLCNGYLVLTALGILPLLDALIDAPPLDPLSHFPTATLRVAVMAAAGLATFAAIRVRTLGADGRPGPRLPYTGTVPAELVRTGVALVSLPALWSPWLAERIFDLHQHATLIELGAMVPLAVLILLTARRPWTTPGLVATAAFLALLGLLPLTTGESFRMAMPIAQGVTLALVIAELIAGVQARVSIEAPTTVLVVHDVARADEASDRLTAAGIPHALLGVRARAALRLLGAYIPVDVRVPAALADEARAALAA